MRSDKRIKTLVGALIVGCYPGKTMSLELNVHVVVVECEILVQMVALAN